MGDDLLAGIQGLNGSILPSAAGYGRGLPPVAQPAMSLPGINNWTQTPSGPGVGGPSADNPWAQKLGANLGTANLALNGIQTVAGLWNAFKMAKLAKAQFKETKAFNRANLANQVSSFNEALDGRARSRGVVEGQTSAQQDAYYDRFKANGLPDDTRKKG
jgi:hypothetical protein